VEIIICRIIRHIDYSSVKENEMRKKSFIAIVSVFVVILGLIMVKTPHPTPIWEINAKQFNSSFNSVGLNATIDDLSEPPELE